MTDEAELSWVQDQIAAAKVPTQVGRAVLSLIRTWSSVEFQNETYRDKTLEVFAKLAKGEALVDDSDKSWHQVVVGGLLNKADRVRVRSDAYDGHIGTQLNGRQGRVLDKRSGRIVVRLDADSRPEQDVSLKVQDLEYQK